MLPGRQPIVIGLGSSAPLAPAHLITDLLLLVLSTRDPDWSCLLGVFCTILCLHQAIPWIVWR